MELEEFNDLEEALAFLQSQGYTHTFHCDQNGWKCKETGQVYAPDQVALERCHRFQRWRRAHKVAVLYQVSVQDGTKGVIIDCCSTYGNALAGEYLLQMKLRQIKSEASGPLRP
ncbi:hypothetical protein ACD591_18240 [Rufibacter glacialis]|uniref:Phosphoribosylpyrophosphate synthetase n=1 Tax=Rufibacter glacialis TaxID=1259555 RepID=A0A5M8Q634_9BACT|nr:hypothetical protein [Rufibacter glacialis]KAA6430783.1 hypothetical protein FOE74_20160 [Rufibacter glacialis]GGK86690.1 hypothetical protein GCM10011405_38070 [Rufibacter glacialis]